MGRSGSPWQTGATRAYGLNRKYGAPGRIVFRHGHCGYPEVVLANMYGTAEIAEQAGAVVRYEYQQGKGNVIRRMFREIDAECYIITDGDDTYPAECAPEMADRVLRHQADMVVGDRLSSTYYRENKRRFHNFGNDLVADSLSVNVVFCDILLFDELTAHLLEFRYKDNRLLN